MHDLGLKVQNKARVEGSIVEAEIVKEITDFFSGYFADHVRTRWKRLIDTTVGEHTRRMIATL